jgi:uncharacterized protein (DUF2062 family)
MNAISADFGFNIYAARRSPRLSFAARLAALQARHEQAAPLSAASGVAVRVALALVPFVGLAWVFVTI